MGNHGKRAPLLKLQVGDGIMIYSPTTRYPGGDPLRAITIVGAVTGADVEPSDIIAGGYRRRADLRKIEPLPLERIRDHVPISRLRFGFVDLPPHDATAIWELLGDGCG